MSNFTPSYYRKQQFFNDYIEKLTDKKTRLQERVEDLYTEISIVEAEVARLTKELEEM
jgi:predicted  nucleic acid-binding Zn-ribbon protein